MKKIIITENQFNFLSERFNEEDIFNYLKSLRGKFKIQTRHGDYPLKIYNDGLSTALNYNPITKFYLDYLKLMKKTTTIMPTPEQMNPNPYNRLNDIIKALDNFPVEVNKTAMIVIGDPTYEQRRDLENSGVKNRCVQMMSALLYEDYFNIDFRYGRFHDEVMKLQIPRSEEDIKKLYDIFMDKDGTIYPPLFFADSNPIVRLLEK